MKWTDEMLATLHRMWPEGHTCAVIGKKLKLSPSAIAGKAHRLMLPLRSSPIKGDGPEMQRRREATKAATITARRAAQGLPPRPAPPPRPPGSPRTPPDPSPVVRPLPPPTTCSWPLGEPGKKGFQFCGKTCLPGKPYCDEHCKLAYVRVKDRREAA